jgi:predicted secreted protein
MRSRAKKQLRNELLRSKLTGYRSVGAGLPAKKGLLSLELFAGKPAPTGFAASGGELNPKGINPRLNFSLSRERIHKYYANGVDIMIRLSITACLLLFGLQVMAEQPPLSYDRVALSVSSEEAVENDILVAVLYAQQEGTDANRLSSAVNRVIDKAVKRAKSEPAVQVRTLDYTTTPQYQKQKLSGWRVRQSIRLESREGAALSSLIGELQQDLNVSSISYTISPERRAQSEERLISQAIASFNRRAGMVTREMGRNGHRLVEMNIDTSDRSPKPYQARAMVMDRSSAAVPPNLEAGTRQLKVTIRGTIELKP